MSEETEARLIWRVKDTLNAIQASLASQTWIRIALPPDCNQALFTRLMRNAPDGQLEQANIEGVLRLLGKVARITGLEYVARPIEPLSMLSTHIRAMTPPSILFLSKLGHGRITPLNWRGRLDDPAARVRRMKETPRILSAKVPLLADGKRRC